MERPLSAQLRALKATALYFGMLCFFCCSNATEIPDPEIERVIPDTIEAGESALVVIEGNRFWVRIRRELSAAEEFRVEDHFVIEMSPEGDTAGRTFDLVDVERKSTQRLTAWVPGDMPSGWYSVRVHTPAGRSGELPRAFRVLGGGDTENGFGVR